MNFRQLVLFGFLVFTALVQTPFFLASAQAAEKTLLLCQGSTRNTARVYQDNETLKMRLYDRRDRVVWLNTTARSEMNPEVITYSNLAGEQTIHVTTNRNDPSLCSIQVGDQPLERGTAVQ
jgi:hypothetical protein